MEMEDTDRERAFQLIEDIKHSFAYGTPGDALLLAAYSAVLLKDIRSELQSFVMSRYK